MITKFDIYKEYGIFYDTKKQKIFAPSLNMWIKPLLKNNNRKLRVAAFSIYPGTNNYTVVLSNGKKLEISGTCPMNCKGCYAQTGCYRYSNVKNGIALITWLCMNDINFVKRAIMAQIKADHIDTIRIHATGDFFNTEYIEMWREIAKENTTVKFWSYTKYAPAEHAFNDIDNINIVKSLIKDCGLNFGHIGYIIDTFRTLKARGEKVHICECGIDSNKHCNECRGCIDNTYVLFIEHSTEYKAKKDPLYNSIVELINKQ